MSDGAWLIFLQRPIALTLVCVSLALLVASAVSMLTARRDWRETMAEETKES
jgi:TctA family transporter